MLHPGSSRFEFRREIVFQGVNFHKKREYLHPAVTAGQYIAENIGSNRNASDIPVGCATVKFLWAK
jgi:hypothetical protein